MKEVNSVGFYLESDVIYLTKGDDAALEISGITAQDGSRYELHSEDVLTLTVRVLPSAESPVLIQIDSLPGSNRIVLRHEDTAELNVGRYSADVQLTTAEGRRFTVWPNIAGSGRYVVKSFNNFVVMPEVTIK